jgi:hypothetical protein
VGLFNWSSDLAPAPAGARFDLKERDRTARLPGLYSESLKRLFVPHLRRNATAEGFQADFFGALSCDYLHPWLLPDEGPA